MCELDGQDLVKDSPVRYEYYVNDVKMYGDCIGKGTGLICYGKHYTLDEDGEPQRQMFGNFRFLDSLGWMRGILEWERTLIKQNPTTGTTFGLRSLSNKLRYIQCKNSLIRDFANRDIKKFAENLSWFFTYFTAYWSPMVLFGKDTYSSEIEYGKFHTL